MTGWKRLGILLMILLAALVCYAVGIAASVFLLVLLGGLFELAFWLGLFKSSQKNTPV